MDDKDKMSLIAKLLDAHKRIYPHHSYLCELCKEAEAAIAASLLAQPEQKQHHVDSDLVAWRIRIGTSDMWAWCETESDADFLGKQSGLKYEKQPLYSKPQQSGSIRSSAEPAGEVVSISASDGYATIGLYDDTIKVGDLVYAGAAPLPELTGPSAGSIGDAADFCGLLLELCESNLADGVAITERIIAYIDSRLATSPSSAPAQPAATVSSDFTSARLFLAAHPDSYFESDESVSRTTFAHALDHLDDAIKLIDRLDGYARMLAMHMWREHYIKTAPQFDLLDDAYGVLSQIDNMLTGLAPAAPLPELTGPSEAEIYVNGDELMNLQLDGKGSLPFSCVRNNFYRTGLCLAASPSPAPAQQPEPSAIESKLRDAVTILRGALVSAECAIKGREHTGFITKALVATEFVTAPSESAETAAPGASTEDKQ